MMSLTPSTKHCITLTKENSTIFLEDLFFLTITENQKSLSQVKPFCSFAMKRSNGLQKLLYQRRQHCPCPNCFNGNYVQCLYTEFLGNWNVEEMEIDYTITNPAADLDHAAAIMPHLQQLQASFKGAFFVIIIKINILSCHRPAQTQHKMHATK